jgi:hypothetical protein
MRDGLMVIACVLDDRHGRNEIVEQARAKRQGAEQIAAVLCSARDDPT